MGDLGEQAQRRLLEQRVETGDLGAQGGG